jgi:hypothetical protein
MRKNYRKINGIQLLYKKYKQAFNIPENLNYYSKSDFRIAERKFLKWALHRGETNKILIGTRRS